MTDNSSETGLPVGRGIPLIGVVIAICVVLGVVYAIGARDLVQRQDETGRAVAQEDVSFCTELGMNVGTSSHLRCVEGLGDLRRRHEERLRSALAGIL